jgi:hypothetical protein
LDPATVPIVRGPHVDRLLDDARADAAAVGETIALSSVHDERSPRTLGLLAHELTHVGQRRQPRFVPPVVRDRAPTDQQAHDRPSEPSPFSEEGMARRVERAVWNDAEQIAEREGGEISPSRREESARVPTPSAFNATSDRDAALWGSLPAPWEPLTLGAATTSDVGVAPLIATPSADAPAIHYAEHDRPVEGQEQTTSAHGAPPAASAPAPDLDALARSVYDVLKRRLAAERRREG